MQPKHVNNMQESCNATSMRQHAMRQACDNNKMEQACNNMQNGLKLKWTALNHAQISGQNVEMMA